MSEFKAFSIGDRVIKAKAGAKRRVKGTIMFGYVSDSKELYQVKWDGSWTSILDWYDSKELRRIGTSAPAKNWRKQRKDWWESIEWKAPNHVEALDKLINEG